MSTRRYCRWGDKCGAVTAKVDFQAMIYEETLTPIYEKHGYTGALWCAMYSLGMVPIVDTSQPVRSVSVPPRLLSLTRL